MAALATLAALAGCATFRDSFVDIERNLMDNGPVQALAVLEKQRVSSRDEVVHLLNKGMLLRMAGDYRESNVVLEQAKRRIDALHGISIREQAGAFVVNDGTRAYVGEEFEQVLIHLYMALNYLDLGELAPARVEALQVDVRLREHAERVPQRRYREDALARYLTGKIYEALGEPSDAMIAYRKAYAAYKSYGEAYGLAMPAFLGPDLLRLATRLGLHQEARQYETEFPATEARQESDGAAELIVTVHTGLAPVKREQSLTTFAPESGRLVRISLPRYEPRANAAASVAVSVNGRRFSASLAQDINAIALRDLEAKMGGITARAIARAALKDQAAKEAGKRDGVVGLALNVANVLTERADTRSWGTLPAAIHVAAIRVPPGRHRVEVIVSGAGGATLGTRDFGEIDIEGKAKRFLSYHWIPSDITRR